MKKCTHNPYNVIDSQKKGYLFCSDCGRNFKPKENKKRITLRSKKKLKDVM